MTARFVLAVLCIAAPATAQPVEVRTPAPVIHLADGSGEVDGLGWCLDTLGRGFAEELQVHSCKPQGGDVQFTWRPEAGSIASVAFAGKCMERLDEAEVAFGLRDCEADAPAQGFAFDAATGAITPADAPDLCVAAGDAIRQAGPFLSRDLILAPCTELPEARRAWIHKT